MRSKHILLVSPANPLGLASGQIVYALLAVHNSLTHATACGYWEQL